MKFIEEKYRLVEFVSIFSFLKHFLEFFAGINFRGFELANIFAGSNFRHFAEKPRKTQKLVPAKISSFKVHSLNLCELKQSLDDRTFYY